nr:hypothetical protein [Sphingobium baderi]
MLDLQPEAIRSLEIPPDVVGTAPDPCQLHFKRNTRLDHMPLSGRTGTNGLPLSPVHLGDHVADAQIHFPRLQHFVLIPPPGRQSLRGAAAEAGIHLAFLIRSNSNQALEFHLDRQIVGILSWTDRLPGQDPAIDGENGPARRVGACRCHRFASSASIPDDAKMAWSKIKIIAQTLFARRHLPLGKTA